MHTKQLNLLGAGIKSFFALSVEVHTFLKKLSLFDDVGDTFLRLISVYSFKIDCHISLNIRRLLIEITLGFIQANTDRLSLKL